MDVTHSKVYEDGVWLTVWSDGTVALDAQVEDIEGLKKLKDVIERQLAWYGWHEIPKDVE